MHPDKLGSHRILEVIATGPLTEVYRAVEEPVGRTVALKALKASISPSSPFASGLSREAQLLAALRHENIPRLLEFGRTASGMWIAMELADGFTLEQVLRRGKQLEATAATAVAIEVARALGHAHARGIVHCDVRPSNIVISREGEVMLVDFSSAQAESLPSTPEPVEGQETLAEPAYMSPEQILGEPVDARSDVFALGVVLCEMLTGTRPFGDAEGRAVAHRIRHGEAPALESAGATLPRALAQLVATCLQKVPADRHGSARELRSALEQVYALSSSLPRRHAISLALARARLIERPPPVDREQQDLASVPVARPSIASAVRMLLGMLVLIVLGGALIHVAFRAEMEGSASVGRSPLELVPASSGAVRVLARPWAHVVVDGQFVETTPFARAIPLAPGTHHVTLKHPAAPDERRTVRLAPGERVVLDVTMRVKTSPTAEPGRSAAPEPSSSSP
jgi:serine/threonine-protein kinase